MILPGLTQKRQWRYQRDLIILERRAMIPQYRVGKHWGVTIVRTGREKPDQDGRRPDDQLVAVVVNGDQHLAERICNLLSNPTE